MPNNSWFNIPTTSVSGNVSAPTVPNNVPMPTPGNALNGPGVSAPTSGGAIGVITASQSAITFAGAPAAVTLVWKVVGQASSSLGTSKVFPIILALVIGMLIWWQSAPSGVTMREKVLGFVFALINSFAIAAATLGIDSAIAS